MSAQRETDSNPKAKIPYMQAFFMGMASGLGTITAFVLVANRFRIERQVKAVIHAIQETR